MNVEENYELGKFLSEMPKARKDLLRKKLLETIRLERVQIVTWVYIVGVLMGFVFGLGLGLFI